MVTNKVCRTRSVVESSIKKSVPSLFMATIDITREYAYVIGGAEFKRNGTKVPKGTVYYTDFDEAYKEFNRLRGEQIRDAEKIKEKNKNG